MPPRYDHLPDIVRDARIETKFLNDSTTQHVRYKSGASARQRRLRREEQWVRSRALGQGAYGTVWLESCKEPGSTKMRAVKEIKKSVTGEELDYRRELEAIFKFSHPNYAHCFVTSDGWYEKDDSIYIIMEYFERGDLNSHLSKSIPEAEAKQITRQVVEGLRFMHSNDFAHRDLKPGNILVANPSPQWFVKIADFGITKRRQDDVTTLNTLRMGTTGYAAPEIFGFPESEDGTNYTFAVDIWSLGAVLCKILTLTTPFQDLGVLYRYAAGISDFPKESLTAQSVSEECCAFIAFLMSATPAQRPSAPSAESHPWLNSAASDTSEQRTTDQDSKLRQADQEFPFMEIPTVRTIRCQAEDGTETIEQRYQRMELPSDAHVQMPSRSKAARPSVLRAAEVRPSAGSVEDEDITGIIAEPLGKRSPKHRGNKRDLMPEERTRRTKHPVVVSSSSETDYSSEEDTIELSDFRNRMSQSLAMRGSTMGRKTKKRRRRRSIVP